MTQIEADIAFLKAKYAQMKGIPTAEAIMRVVKELEKENEILCRSRISPNMQKR